MSNDYGYVREAYCLAACSAKISETSIAKRYYNKCVADSGSLKRYCVKRKANDSAARICMGMGVWEYFVTTDGHVTHF